MSGESDPIKKVRQETPEEVQEKIYASIRKKIYVPIQVEVMKRYGIEDDSSEWGDGNNLSLAAKFALIFEQAIKEEVEEGNIKSADDVAGDNAEKLIEYILQCIHEQDARSEFNAKYDELSRNGSLKPMVLENDSYRMKEGHMWVYNLIQSDVMWSRYRNRGGVNQNIEEWKSSSSREYNEAMRKMIAIHGDELLELFRKNYFVMIEQVERLMINISEIEMIIEQHLGKEHTDRARDEILAAFELATKDEPEVLLRLHEPEVRAKVVEWVEQEMAKGK